MRQVGAIVLEDVGRQIAEALGVEYGGVQRDSLELFAGHTFTDMKTGGTFFAKDASEGVERLMALRQRFGSEV